MQKKILVPVGPGGRSLKSVHYALALAERLQARVLILQWRDSSGGRALQSSWLDEALSDVVTNARLAGLSLSHLTVSGRLEDEVASVVEQEAVDLLVLSAEQSELEMALLHTQPKLSSNIIRVKEKDTMDVSVEEGGPRWPS